MGGQLRLKLEHSPDYGRSRFVVSDANRDAVKVLDAWPKDRGGTLALIGPAGSGKSHLAAAWADRTGARVLTHDRMEDEAADPACRSLLLDAADAAPHGEAFFHLLNKASRPGCSLLLTGRTPPGAWPVQVQDVRSRLNALQVVELKAPDDGILHGVLVKLFQERSIRPSPELLAYLVSRIERSAPAAQAIVAALDEAAAADHRPVSRALARQLLKDDGNDGEDETVGEAS